MKITKSKLKQLIKEELQSLMEMPTRTDATDARRDRYAAANLTPSGRYRDYSEPRGPSKPARKIKQLPPVEKADDRLLDNAYGS